MGIESAIAFTALILTIIQWLWEYSQKIKWDKNVFLVYQLEKFNEAESTKIVNKLLDWNKVEITLKDSNVVISDDDLIEALQPHDRKHRFTQTESQLRTIFDEYFDNLTKLVYLCNTKIVPEKSLRMMLGYWINILKGESKKIQAINSYLSFYGYDELIKFIQK